MTTRRFRNSLRRGQDQWAGWLLLFFLTACGAADQGAVSEPASNPPTSQTDLVPLLLQPGDLPDNISGTRADDPRPLNFVNDPPADRIDGLRLVQAGREAGSASVLLYEKPTDLTQAYQRLTASVLADAGADSPPRPTPAIGEQAVAARLALASSTYGTNHVDVIVFVRCRALIDVRLNELASLTMDQAVAYAKHLDQRIATLACG